MDYRSLSLVLTVCAGIIIGYSSSAEAQVRAQLPFIQIDSDGGEVHVDVPFVRVYHGVDGTRTRAPFTNIDIPHQGDINSPAVGANPVIPGLQDSVPPFLASYFPNVPAVP